MRVCRLCGGWMVEGSAGERSYLVCRKCDHREELI